MLSRKGSIMRPLFPAVGSIEQSCRTLSLRCAALAAAALSFPLLPASAQTPVQWRIVDGGNDHYYEFVTGAFTWTQARAQAESMQFLGMTGHLATVTSAAENAFLATSLPFTGWIGLFQEPGSPEPGGGWAWITGELFGFTNWQTDEPNNLGEENHGEILIGDRWNDALHDTAQGFIVEYGTNLQGAAPEPGTLALALPALALSIALRRRKRRP